MVSAWNVDELDKMVLPPCHYGFQCYTRELSFGERNEIQRNANDYMSMYTNEEMDKNGIPTRKLSLKWSQRSCDSFLGIPFNIASYGLLLHLLAREVNMIPDELIFSGGDCHIYLNHIEAVEKQLESETFKLPKLELKNTSIFNLKFEDFNILEYNSSPTIKAELSN
jgi:thymidylate synthase